MTSGPIELIEPRRALRGALIDYIEEFCRAGETLWQPERERVRRDFAGYLRELHDRAQGTNVPPNRVPDTHYWLVREGRILGSLRIRHRLTDKLAIEGGHIGYEVRPSERRKGYATRMLGMALGKARELGLSRVLVTCDKDNTASARVIRANGGQFHSEVRSPRTGKTVQRYWIDLAVCDPIETP